MLFEGSKLNSAAERNQMQNEQPSYNLSKRASASVLWSFCQVWISRLLTFIIFVILARFLSPADYGVAAAAQVCILFVQLIAELGFGDAIIQRKDLSNDDLNLPFVTSLVISFMLSVAVFVLAEEIQAQLSLHTSINVIRSLAGIAPLTTIMMFQEFLYRRNLQFRYLALRSFSANSMAGLVAVIAAFLGAGLWSIIIQSYVVTIVGLIFLWKVPLWRPSFKFNPTSFFALLSFGFPVIALRLIDFIATRAVEFIIVSRFGVSTLGLFAVGSRLYQTLMQLLQGALNDVSLSILSKISHDTAKMRDVYLCLIGLSALCGAPIFIILASLSPEVCNILFGAHWSGVARFSTILMLLGSIQCIQFLNGPFLSAHGKPAIIFRIGVAKYGAIIFGLWTFSYDNALHLVIMFALLQLIATPLSFLSVKKALGFNWLDLFRILTPTLSCGLLAFGSVNLARMTFPLHNDLSRIICYGMVFALTYAVGIAVLGKGVALTVVMFMKTRFTARHV